MKLILTPSESPLPSNEARPATFGAKSFKPEPARSSPVALRLTLTGVMAESDGLSGPAFPVRLIAPPPCTAAESENGNAEVVEKSRSSILTCSSTKGFQWPTVLRRLRRQLVILMSFAERSMDVLAEVLDLPPKPEKFQSPELPCTSAISG